MSCRSPNSENSVKVKQQDVFLTVTLLEPSSGTTTTKLLGLAPSGVRHKQGPIVPHKNVLDFLLALLVHVLLVKGYERLSYALSDRVDLRCVSSALHANPHVDAGETVSSQQEDRLVGFEAQDLRLYQLDWTAVDLDQTATTLAVSDGDSRLLAAETLYRLHRGWGSSCHFYRETKRNPN